MQFLIIFLVEASLLQLDLTGSVGQIILDSSGNNLDSILGTTLLVESTDAILTDRGAYFNAGTRISLPPNNLHPESLPPISSSYVFTLTFKVLSAGCILSVTNSGSTLQSLCWSGGVLTFTQNGASLTSAVSLGIPYLDIWTVVNFGYNVVVLLDCISLGLELYVTSPCTSSLGSTLSLSTTDTIVLGTNPVTSSNFQGFVSGVYLYSGFSAALGAPTVIPTGSDVPLETSGGVACSCGSYSCLNNNPADCNVCDSSCGEFCSGTASTDCLNVQNLCSPYYYDAATGKCDSTILEIPDCSVQVSSTVCSSCNSGYYLSVAQDGCCLYRYYYSSGSCLACSSDCYTCSGALSTQCLSCVSGASVAGNGACQCSTGYYTSSSSPLACTACNSNCLSCSGGTSSDCLSCVTGASVTSGVCQCNNGYYQSQSSPLVCTSCDSTCLTCNGGTSSNCLTCVTSATATAGVCTCNSGYYPSQSSPLACTACDPTCVTCSGGTSSDCLDCVAAATASSGVCLCNAGYYPSQASPLICTACEPTCATCNGGASSSCLTCVAGASVVSGACLCSTGYYLSQSSPLVCSACHSNCLACTGGTALDCSSCITNASTSSPGPCVCDTGYYQSSTSPIVCGICYQDCSSCQGGASADCLSCADPHSSTASPGPCSCIFGYYASSVSPLACTGCNTDCTSCSLGTSSSCLTCSDANASTNSPGPCTCNGGYYPSSLSPLVCTQCDADCATCSSGTSSDCLLCTDTHATSLSPGPCICNAGYFSIQTSPLICSICDISCLTCSVNSLNCNSCTDPNALVSLGVCVCSGGYYASATIPLVCSICNIDCATCSAGTNSDCLTCADPNALTLTTPGACSCKSTYFPSSTSPLVCSPCNIDCSSCVAGTSADCMACAGTNAITNAPGACYCGTGFFPWPSTIFSCKACNYDCMTCSGSEPWDCYTCSDPNAYLVQTPGETIGSCACNDHYFPSQKTPLICTECDSSCSNCTGSGVDQCTSCTAHNAGTLTNPGECICNEGYFNTSASPLVCSACNVACGRCNGPSPNNCTSCNHLQYLVNNSCVCVQGLVINYTTGQCLSCIDQCQECADTSTCSKCRDGFYYDAERAKCENCDASCKNCSGPNENQCFSCRISNITPSQYTNLCTCDTNQYVETPSPLVCKNCTEGCMECISLNCFKCSQGYTLIGYSCARDELKLTVTVTENNTIVFTFSEALLSILSTSDFTMHYQSQVLVFELTPIRNNTYNIVLISTPSAIGSILLSIEFKSRPLGESNSILSVLEYSCTLILTNGADSLSKVMQNINTVISTLVAGSVFTSVMSNNQPSLVWASLNTAQILCYVPLQNIALPNTLNNFLKAIQPINILPNYWISTGFYNCTDTEINAQFFSYGYSCNYFITNTGELLLAFTLSVAILPFFVIIYYLTTGKVSRYFFSKISEYRWNFFIRYWIEGFIDLMIACVISFSTVRVI